MADFRDCQCRNWKIRSNDSKGTRCSICYEQIFVGQFCMGPVNPSFIVITVITVITH